MLSPSPPAPCRGCGTSSPDRAGIATAGSAERGASRWQVSQNATFPRLPNARNWPRIQLSGSPTAQSRVEGVAESVAEHVEAEDRDEDGYAGADREPGVLREVTGGDEDHRTPVRRGRLRAKAEEAESRLRQDRRATCDRRLHNQRADDVRQDVPANDAS